MHNKILITGGAGYIGSHTTLALLQEGYQVVVLDNLSNGSIESLRRISRITGSAPIFIEGDIRDKNLLDRIFSEHKISATIHFAGLKSVGQSVSHPSLYYDNNVYGSLTLLEAMRSAGIFKFIFSSSAAVYGDSADMPLIESAQIMQPTSPYGRSKLIVEDMLRDFSLANPLWNIAILRYFNPVGAHSSGLIGEDSKGVPSNLLPCIGQVAGGRLPELVIYGDDYPTPDGTGIRDYIHVMDLAEGHLRALGALGSFDGAQVWNLGGGVGFSVMDMLQAFEAEIGRRIPYRIAARRPGDIAVCYADPTKAIKDLGWRTLRHLPEMIGDTWRWQSMNPFGFAN
jgi:UDP-glucose 4-epimerase